MTQDEIIIHKLQSFDLANMVPQTLDFINKLLADKAGTLQEITAQLKIKYQTDISALQATQADLQARIQTIDSEVLSK